MTNTCRMPSRGEAAVPVGNGFAADAGMTATAPTAATSARAAVSLRGTAGAPMQAGVSLPSPFRPEFLPAPVRVRRVGGVRRLVTGQVGERRLGDDLRHRVAVPPPTLR